MIQIYKQVRKRRLGYGLKMSVSLNQVTVNLFPVPQHRFAVLRCKNIYGFPSQDFLRECLSPNKDRSLF